MKSNSKLILLISVLVFLTIVPYWRSLSCSFVHDDILQIVRNPLLRPPAPIYKLWLTDVWGYEHPGEKGKINYYRPLQMATYRMLGSAFGFVPGYFHAVNVGFHLLATLAGFGLLYCLTRELWISFWASVLFAAHPVHTEAVIWVSALPDLACGFFYFLSFLFFLKTLEKSAVITVPKKKTKPIPKPGMLSPRIRWMSASVFSFAIATLWKEMALSLPFLLAAYSFMHVQTSAHWVQRIKLSLRQTIPYLIWVFVYLGIRLKVLGFIATRHQNWDLSALQFFLNAIYLLGDYWLKLIWPYPLNSYHLFDPVQLISDPRFLLAAVFVFFAAGFLWMASKRFVSAGFAMCWVFIALIPVLNIEGVGENVLAERYLYIPSLGYCWLFVWAVNKIKLARSQSSHSPVWAVFISILALIFGWMCSQRTLDWKDNFNFALKAVEGSPQSVKMNLALGLVLLNEKQDIDAALRQFYRTIDIAKSQNRPPNDQITRAFAGIASVYLVKQDSLKVAEIVNQGLHYDPDSASLLYAQGVNALLTEQFEIAEKSLTRAHKLIPADENTIYYLGILSLKFDRREEARQYFIEALNIFPDFFDANLNMATLLAQEGKFTEALPYIETAARLRPQDITARCYLGMVLARLGRREEARSTLRSVLSLSPNHPLAQAELNALGTQ